MKKLALFLSFLFVISCSKDPIIYTLTTSANPAEGGTVSPSSATFEEGQTATITASPSSDYVFQSWSGATGSTSSTSVLMNSDKTVTANFVKKKFALTISVEGEGTVTEKIIKAGAATDYTIGSVIELTANPSDEWLFVEWKGDVTGTENPVEITVDKAKALTAVFVKKQYPLTIEVEGEGTVAEEVIKAGAATDYNSGTVVELTATGKTGWEFKEWTGDLESTENPAEITIDKDKTVTAIFIKELPFYFDENGTTIKARGWVTAGITGELNGVTYTAVDNGTLKSMADDDDFTKVVTTLVDDMSELFRGNQLFNQDIGNWDVSNVNSMNNMFNNAASFNKDIGSWNVSNVTDMAGMFVKTYFNQDIGSWDVSNVTSMDNMFGFTYRFNQDISSWDVSSVTRMGGMFDNSPFNQDIGSWDVSSVTYMSFMFRNSPLNQDIGSWNVSSVTDMSFMFTETEVFNQDIGSWDVSNVTNLHGMFVEAEVFNQDIGSWDVSNVTNMRGMFNNTASFNKDIGSWNVSNVTDMAGMFNGAEVFNQDIGSWDVGNVTLMFNMFNEAEAFNQDLSKWCVSSIKSEPTNFSRFSALAEINKPIWGTCPSESTIWNGTTITFTKADGANPEEEANQDRITDNIWITRGNDGGQIFNIKTETSYNKTDSPVGTKWAVGTLDEIETLTFKKFRAAVEKPNSSLVGKNLVMYLEEDDIYLSIKFTSWSEQKNGGFAYERSTKP
jgi:surface protein